MAEGSSPRRSRAIRGPAVPASILIVDDDKGMRELLKEAIEYRGYSAILAPNGAEALTLWGAQRDVAAIVCDLEMPVMDGLTFIQHVAQVKPAARVLASSGGGSDKLHLAEEFGIVRATLKKPFSMAAFWAALDKTLASGPRRNPYRKRLGKAFPV